MANLCTRKKWMECLCGYHGNRKMKNLIFSLNSHFMLQIGQLVPQNKVKLHLVFLISDISNTMSSKILIVTLQCVIVVQLKMEYFQFTWDYSHMVMVRLEVNASWQNGKGLNLIDQLDFADRKHIVTWYSWSKSLVHVST